MKTQKPETQIVLHTDERADELAVPEPKVGKGVMSARAETARERREELAGQAILLAALAATPEPEPVTAEDSAAPVETAENTPATIEAVADTPAPLSQEGAVLPEFSAVTAYLAGRQEEGDRIARERIMAPVREARDRMKHSVQRLLETRAEVVKRRREYLPTLIDSVRSTPTRFTCANAAPGSRTPHGRRCSG